LKSALAFVLTIELVNDNEEAISNTALIAVYAPMIVLGSIPVICLAALYKYRNRLEEQAILDRIEKMYVGVSLNRNAFAKYIYPVFLARRFLFVIIPISFPGHPTF
jgi:hypothetical protein